MTPTRRSRTSTPSPPPEIVHKQPDAVTRTERQTGKVTTLALGFGGSVGALQAMALNYRVAIDRRGGPPHCRRVA